MPNLNTSPHIYITVWEDLHYTAQMYNANAKKGVTFILAVFLPLRHVVETAVFCCENETTLFGLPKEDTTRNQWLSCIYNTVPEQFNPN